MNSAYHEPRSLDEAIALIESHGAAAAVLAGGVTFLPMMKERRSNDDPPALVLSLGKLSELRGIRAESDGLWIGAMTTHREVECSDIVRKSHAVIADTWAQIGSVRIRNQATLGGNLACGDPTFDPPVTLIALDATVVIAGPGATRREVPIAGFCMGQDGSSLGPTELIAAIRVPALASGLRARHVKVRSRSAAGQPTVTVAAAVQLGADGRIDDVRLALGAVGPTVVRANRTEEALRGHWPTQDVLRDASALVAQEIDPSDDIRGSITYKRHVACVWVARTLATAAGRQRP
jgi:aerobic carbon-monoxide dehydrogenase medium subunit